MKLVSSHCSCLFSEEYYDRKEGGRLRVGGVKERTAEANRLRKGLKYLVTVDLLLCSYG